MLTHVERLMQNAFFFASACAVGSECAKTAHALFENILNQASGAPPAAGKLQGSKSPGAEGSLNSTSSAHKPCDRSGDRPVQRVVCGGLLHVPQPPPHSTPAAPPGQSSAAGGITR